jgi:hypothetical protein
MKTIKIHVKPSRIQADIKSSNDSVQINLPGNVNYSPLDCSTTINQTVKDTINRNGHYEYTYNRLEATGLDTVVLDVNIPSDAVPVQEKSVVYDQNGEYTITPDPGYDLSKVDVSINLDTSAFYEEGRIVGRAEGYAQGFPDGEAAQKDKLIPLDVTANGYYHRVDGFSEVTVDVPATPLVPTQSKSVSYDQNGEYTILPDQGYNLSQVDVSVNLDTSAYYDQGYTDGSTAGYTAGYVDGNTVGYNNGYHDGELDGYNEGYPAGVNAQKAKLDSSTFTANGQYTREDGWNDIIVNVPSTPPVPTQSKSVAYTSNGEYTVTPDQGYNLSQVDVSVNIDTQEYYDQGYEDGSTAGIAYQKSLLDSSTFTANGTYTREDGWGSVTVNVPSTPGGSLQAKTTDASVNNITITPDASYYGLSEVTVNGVDASIDSNIQPGNIKEGVTILGVQGTYAPDSSGGGTEYYIYDSLTHNNDGLYDTGIPVTLTTIVEYQGTTLDDGNITHGVYTQNDGNSEFRLFGYGQQFYYDRREGDHRLVGGYNDGSTHVIEAGNFYLKVDGNLETQDTTITENDEYAKYSDANICVFGAYTLQDMSQYSLANGEVTVNYFKIYDGSTLVRELVPAEDASGNVGLFDKVEQVFYPNLESGTGTLGDYVETITVGGGGDMHPQQKTVDASTERVIVTPDTSLGYNALSRVTINPVDASIDPDIIPENIKLGVNILGVEGTMSTTYNGRNQAKTVDSSTVTQTVTFDIPDYTGLSEVTVNPYSLEHRTVDASTSSQTVYPTINYDGLESVTINPYVLDNKTVNPSTSQQVVTSSEDGLESVTVNAVTASIDPNITPENIKAGVNILGVTGELTDDTQVDLQDKTVTPTNSLQTITADSSYDGLGTVYVNPAPTETINVDSSTELQTITPSVGHIGFSQVTINPYELESVVVDSSITQQVITPISGYDGLSQVTVNPYTVQSKTIAPATTAQIVLPDSSVNALSQVTVSAVTSSIDPNIQAANIVNGVTILGVTGTYTSPASSSAGYEEIYNRLIRL